MPKNATPSTRGNPFNQMHRQAPTFKQQSANDARNVAHQSSLKLLLTIGCQKTIFHLANPMHTVAQLLQQIRARYRVDAKAICVEEIYRVDETYRLGECFLQRERLFIDLNDEEPEVAQDLKQEPAKPRERKADDKLQKAFEKAQSAFLSSDQNSLEDATSPFRLTPNQVQPKKQASFPKESASASLDSSPVKGTIPNLSSVDAKDKLANDPKQQAKVESGRSAAKGATPLRDHPEEQASVSSLSNGESFGDRTYVQKKIKVPKLSNGNSQPGKAEDLSHGTLSDSNNSSLLLKKTQGNANQRRPSEDSELSSSNGAATAKEGDEKKASNSAKQSVASILEEYVALESQAKPRLESPSSLASSSSSLDSQPQTVLEPRAISAKKSDKAFSTPEGSKSSAAQPIAANNSVQSGKKLAKAQPVKQKQRKNTAEEKYLNLF